MTNRTVIGGSNKLLTTREAAEYLALPSVRTLQDNWKKWGIPAAKFGRGLKFRVRDLDSFVARREVNAKVAS